MEARGSVMVKMMEKNEKMTMTTNDDNDDEYHH